MKKKKLKAEELRENRDNNLNIIPKESFCICVGIVYVDVSFYW